MKKYLLITLLVMFMFGACCAGSVYLMQSGEADATPTSTAQPILSSPVLPSPVGSNSMTTTPDAAAPIFATHAAAETQFAATTVALTPAP